MTALESRIHFGNDRKRISWLSLVSVRIELVAGRCVFCIENAVTHERSIVRGSESADIFSQFSMDSFPGRCDAHLPREGKNRVFRE
jgi:hypothetical protein